MKEIRIYQIGNFQVGDKVELSSSASQHVVTVLRMKIGASISLFGNDNRECHAEIIAIEKKRAIVNILSIQTINRESPCAIHLAQAISKGERMEIIIQKAVELGVNSITPLITEHCVVRLDQDRLTKKHKQWEAIAIAACEQCGRNIIPTIHAPCTLNTYIQTCQIAQKLILHPNSHSTLKDCELNLNEMAVLLGPEGGFSSEEVRLAIKENFQAISLGPRILRTETATITILSILQAIKGDLGFS